MRRRTWVLGAVAVCWSAGGCASKVIGFDDPDGAAGTGAANGGGETTLGECRSVPMNADPLSARFTDGQTCALPFASDECQLCSCLPDGTSVCSEYNCNVNGCPPRVPDAYAACAGEPCECLYDSGCGQPHRATCVSGGWQVEIADCSPPCPTDPPTDGELCWNESLRCDYGTGCDAVHAACGGPSVADTITEPVIDTWHLLPAPLDCPDPLCPPVPPAPGSPCQPDRPSCWWTEPGSNCQEAVPYCAWLSACGAAIQGSCDITGWSIQDPGCGGQPGCPMTQPRTGDACDAPTASDSQSCEYALGLSLNRCDCGSNHRWACHEWYNMEGGSDAVVNLDQPGAVPSMGTRCMAGGWCPEVGVTYPSCNMICTAGGWQPEP